MKFKKYHGYIHAAMFSAALIIVLSLVSLVLSLFDGVSVKETVTDEILFPVLCILASTLCAGTMFFYVSAGTRKDGGHFKDEIEMNDEGIRLRSRKTEDVFIAWENVVEILDVRSYMAPMETVVRGSNAEINFFGKLRARAYLKRKTGLKKKNSAPELEGKNRLEKKV